jgi:hypothetical protein
MKKEWNVPQISEMMILNGLTTGADGSSLS